MIVFKGGGRTSAGGRTGIGTGFGGLAAYLRQGPLDALNPDRVAWISYRNLDGIDDPSRAAQTMRIHASEHPRTQRPVYHFGLSLHPGEHLTREQWEQAVDRVLHRMGLEAHQAVVIAHHDTDKQHVHFVVNRVSIEGRAWDIHNDKLKARDAVRGLEIDFGLIRTGAGDLPLPELTPGAYQQASRTGQQPLTDRVRNQAAGAFAEATTWRDLEERLAIHGFRLAPSARGSGVLVSDGRRSASLSHVDRSLSGPRLASRFGETFRDHRLAHPEPPTVVVPGNAPSPLAGSSIEQRAAALVEHLTATRATFTAADLQRAAFHQPESVALVREAMQSAAVLEVGRDTRGATRYTTREYLDAEARLLTSASCLASRGHFRLDSTEVNQILDRSAPHLSEEQRGAVRHATTEADLAQIVGRAGAGKTTAARAIASVYLEHGYELRGAALAGKAAAVLEAETGIPSRTLASLEHAWSEGRDRLHDRSVLVIDEAGMVDARRLGRVLATAEERGAKVVLLGDPDQLKAIGAGDAYRGLLEQYPSAHIDTIRRQQEPWQRAASQDLAGGRVAAALDSYEGAGRLHWTETRAEARAEILSHYRLDRAAEPGASQLILAYRNADVALLNQAVRGERGAAGELGPGVKVAGMEISAGDRLVFLRNDNHGREVANLDPSPTLGVRNGTLGTVLSAEPHRVTVRLDDHRSVAFEPSRYDAVALGYAVTIHKSQGATVDRGYVLADPLMNRHAAYVALTRHRDSVQVFADRETFAGRDQLDRALSRDGRKDLAGDYGSAELRRAVTRLQDLAAKTAGLAREERPLREALAAFETLREARLHVVDARRSVAGAVRQVYAEPAKALRNLLRDPSAPEHLRRGAADLYGQLRGMRRVTANSERSAAIRAVQSLTGRLESYHRSLAGLTGAKHTATAQLSRFATLRSPAPPAHVGRQSAGKQVPARGLRGSQISLRPPQIKRELARVASALHTYRQASRGAQEAIEVAIRGMSRLTVNSALLLLPPGVALPVGLAVRAIERAFDRGLDIGLGR